MTALLPVIVIAEFVVLFLISRLSVTRLFQALRVFTRRDSVVFGIISFLFFPGTVIHELAHFIMATILFLKVRDIHVFPEWDGSYIKLGSVHYEKKDVLRGILVGIAPIIVGILLLWWMHQIEILGSGPLWFRALMIYVVFVISTSMFSSKQDLVDIVYLIPVTIIVAGIMYIFDIDISGLLSRTDLIAAVNNFLYAIFIYLGISIAIHAVTVVVLSLLLQISKKH